MITGVLMNHYIKRAVHLKVPIMLFSLYFWKFQRRTVFDGI